MTRLELTESLTLAIKLKAEVERVFGLLDEKDARIAAVEAELYEWQQAIRSVAPGCVPTANAAQHAIQELFDKWQTAKARIAALESELAATGREYKWLKDQNVDISRYLTKDRDRERSRREALERALGFDTPWPVDELLQQLADAAEHLLGHHGCDTHGHEGIRYAQQEAVKMVGAILDRAAEQDSTGSLGQGSSNRAGSVTPSRYRSE